MSNIIDLRSDTVTLPSPNMRRAMNDADVGDDVYGEDPTVNRLQALAAEISGHEAALFVASGTQSNLIALLCHCQRGDEYIVGQEAHTYKYEAGGAAVLGSIQPQPLRTKLDGSLDLGLVERTIKPDDIHFARTTLLTLENTTAGVVVPQDYIDEARLFCRDHQLRFHLDGARVCNAAVAQDISLDTITQCFDSVSICLSKGLGAPVGSVLCGDKEMIEQALRWRKMLGGGMRQAGILAAAGIYALEHNIDRLKDDHDNLQALVAGLSSIDEISIEEGEANTNIAFINIPDRDDGALQIFAENQGIKMSNGTRIRLVTHLDITPTQIEKVIETFKSYYSE